MGLVNKDFSEIRKKEWKGIARWMRGGRVMETMERIISWFGGTSFYQKFCVNLLVPFNNAYFEVVFLVFLGVSVGWKIVDRIHSLRFRLRIRRKKESVLERQLEQEAKEQERNRQMEAINQNNLLYMQFLQTAMLSHIG